MIIDAVVVNVLTLTQEVDTNIKILNVEQMLGISDAVRPNILPQHLSSSLYLTQSIEVAKTISLSASDTLTLTQGSQPRVLIENVSQFLFIWQEAIREDQYPSVSQSLVLSQSATYTLSKSAFDILELTQSVTVAITRNLTIAHNVPLVSGAVGFIPQLYAGCS